jgi:hypothetical protein
MSETGGTWKVYEKQWVIVFASDLNPQQGSGKRQCEDRLEGSWAGKVDSLDVKIEAAFRASMAAAARFPWYLKLRLWVLIAEYNGDPTAQWTADGGSEDRKIVRTGSKEERELLDYGRKNLA